MLGYALFVSGLDARPRTEHRFIRREVTDMVKAQREQLTPRQREILDWVKDFIRDNEMPPTVREIGAAFDIKSSSVFELLKALERKGYVRRGDRSARSLIVEGKTRRRRSGGRSVEVPVVGSIPAGQPLEAIEDDRGSVAVNVELLAGHRGFALKVEGESMIDAGVLDGDYVIVRQQESADNGDIVVALIEDEATLKCFYRERGGIRLEPPVDLHDRFLLVGEERRVLIHAQAALELQAQVPKRGLEEDVPERALRRGVHHDPELVIESVAHRCLLSVPPGPMPVQSQ